MPPSPFFSTRPAMVRLPKVAKISALSLLAFFACMQEEQTSLPSSETEIVSTFLGSNNCASCHQKEFKEWAGSDHYQSMQETNDSTVLGNFKQRPLTLDGVDYTFSTHNGTYLLTTKEKGAEKKEHPLIYTFGYFPLQQYLAKTEGGRLQATRLSWDSREKKWFHQYPGQQLHQSDWLHWTGNGQNWNTMCASCHSTNFKKNYDFESDTYASTFSEINVACESCHGAGAKHAAHIQSESYRKGERLANAGLQFGKNSDHLLQLTTCAPCHARKSDIAEVKAGGSEWLNEWIPELISNEHYYADGQIREENFEYGSFVQSKMFHNKVKCSDCHNPHSGKLKKEGNLMCLSCHDSNYDSESHHFHKGKGASTQCINCHMPERTYMGNDHRRDHSFRIPRPDQSLVYHTPNTCNTCHNQKTATWAAEAIKKWYGPKRAYHFSDDLLAGSQLNTHSQAPLMKLASDTSQPEIARATAIYYLSHFQDEKTCEFLINLSRDEKALVRYQAFRTLEYYPPALWAHAASHGLKDRVKGVRIATADLYHLAGQQWVPASAQSAYSAADAENKASLRYQRDFALGNVMMGDYYLQSTEYKNAIVHYLRGLKKDSLMNYARLNLSSAYNAIQQNEEALKTLKDAETIDPKNSDTQHNLALLYYETGNTNLALHHFKKALLLTNPKPDLYYNYGLLLQQTGNKKQAESLFLQGHQLYPGSPKINYALCSFYLKENRTEQAKAYGSILYQLDPDNKTYLDLFRHLGLR